ncbi:MAG: sensor domain-containing diguanylate cyclase [Geminicoccaceae bacterium]|nr:MAG: sensor domain-containing diguanylate cyclase [Geminicoccaceae bacterium]
MSPSPGDVETALQDPERRQALWRTGLLDSPAEVEFDRVTRLIRDLLHCEVAVISLVDEDRQFFKSTQGMPEPWCRRRQTPACDSMCQFVIASGAPLLVEDAREVAFLRDKGVVAYMNVVAYLGVPLRAPTGEVIGAVCAVESHPRSWCDADVGWLSDLAEILRTELKLRHEAGHDALTGLANRRQFDAALAVAIAAASSGGPAAGLMTVDLDRFKPINDDYGHAAGDAVLRATADRLVMTAQTSDLAARIGGDEFALLTRRGLDLGELTALANQFHRRLAVPFEVEGHRLRIAASTGVATTAQLTPEAGRAEALMAAADQALYHMKSARRRTV